jgi:hypothetical protein
MKLKQCGLICFGSVEAISAELLQRERRLYAIRIPQSPRVAFADWNIPNRQREYNLRLHVVPEYELNPSLFTNKYGICL